MKTGFLLLAFGAVWLGIAASAMADTSAMPDKVFTADRYRALWIKNPFAVASTAPEAAPDGPAPFKLVGVNRFGGVCYANLVNNETGQSVFLEQDKPKQGITLLSIQPGKIGQISSAKVINKGQLLTLQTDNTILATAPVPTNPLPPQFSPGGQIRAGFPGVPPRFAVRRQAISVPSQPVPQQNH
jgi:hypothetical protein